MRYPFFPRGAPNVGVASLVDMELAACSSVKRDPVDPPIKTAHGFDGLQKVADDSSTDIRLDLMWIVLGSEERRDHFYLHQITATP